MGMSFWKVGDGDSNVAWRGGRGLSIPALLPHCSEDKVPVTVDFAEDYFMPQMFIINYKHHYGDSKQCNDKCDFAWYMR